MTNPHLANDCSKGGEQPKIIGAGLPNIKGSFKENTHRIYLDGEYTGALQAMGYSRATQQGSNSGVGEGGFIFDASLSNKIYGNNSTVQPPAISAIIQSKF